MTLARPGREEQENPCSGFGRDRPPFVRLEHAERPRAGVERLIAGLDPRLAFHDQHEGMLLDLMVAERLASLEHDEHGARRLVGIEHDR